ncbi:Jacalin [Musa troglodytarum]|uniref:Jacalin n=1 Tax=Musa troglodytarum TaxID=320322 RepID=A0A9E7LDU7_9LILI|nr:Jacalin [Musa troglodytarum]URE46832.1 Jacalin [Musa troglodytarum]URE46833.1 Jacalin [Musa troglodytarum]URE46834.1 Jacalin [Musa troglodytarum]URE46835.1 Jacalin [Musa troglodytarum]
MNESQTGEVFVKIGPHGSTSGYEWDDGCFDGVREIFIWHDSAPRSLQFVYESAGRPVLSDRHGSEDEVKFFDTIELEYPSEYLTGLRGQSWRFQGGLTSLMFFSNKRSFGPFGHWENGRDVDFQWKVMGNKICGFFGGAQPSSLTAVGIHLRPLPKTS